MMSMAESPTISTYRAVTMAERLTGIAAMKRSKPRSLVVCHDVHHQSHGKQNAEYPEKRREHAHGQVYREQPHRKTVLAERDGYIGGDDFSHFSSPLI